MRCTAAALSLLAALAFPAGVTAHEGHSHKVMGIVKAVDAMHMEIETKEGERVSALLSQETKYLRGKAPASADEVKVGDRVVVTLVEKEGKKTVQEVLLAPAIESTVFTCPMHPEVIQENPGKCSKCGMNLTPKK